MKYRLTFLDIDYNDPPKVVETMDQVRAAAFEFFLEGAAIGEGQADDLTPERAQAIRNQIACLQGVSGEFILGGPSKETMEIEILPD